MSSRPSPGDSRSISMSRVCSFSRVAASVTAHWVSFVLQCSVAAYGTRGAPATPAPAPRRRPPVSAASDGRSEQPVLGGIAHRSRRSDRRDEHRPGALVEVPGSRWLARIRTTRRSPAVASACAAACSARPRAAGPGAGRRRPGHGCLGCSSRGRRDRQKDDGADRRARPAFKFASSAMTARPIAATLQRRSPPSEPKWRNRPYVPRCIGSLRVRRDITRRRRRNHPTTPSRLHCYRRRLLCCPPPRPPSQSTTIGDAVTAATCRSQPSRLESRLLRTAGRRHPPLLLLHARTAYYVPPRRWRLGVPGSCHRLQHRSADRSSVSGPRNRAIAALAAPPKAASTT